MLPPSTTAPSSESQDDEALPKSRQTSVEALKEQLQKLAKLDRKGWRPPHPRRLVISPAAAGLTPDSTLADQLRYLALLDKYDPDRLKPQPRPVIPSSRSQGQSQAGYYTFMPPPRPIIPSSLGQSRGGYYTFLPPPRPIITPSSQGQSRGGSYTLMPPPPPPPPSFIPFSVGQSRGGSFALMPPPPPPPPPVVPSLEGQSRGGFSQGSPRESKKRKEPSWPNVLKPKGASSFLELRAKFHDALELQIREMESLLNQSGVSSEGQQSTDRSPEMEEAKAVKQCLHILNNQRRIAEDQHQTEVTKMRLLGAMNQTATVQVGHVPRPTSCLPPWPAPYQNVGSSANLDILAPTMAANEGKGLGSRAQVDATGKAKAFAVSISPPREPARPLFAEMWKAYHESRNSIVGQQSTMSSNSKNKSTMNPMVKGVVGPFAPIIFPSPRTVANQYAGAYDNPNTNYPAPRTAADLNIKYPVVANLNMHKQIGKWLPAGSSNRSRGMDNQDAHNEGTAPELRGMQKEASSAYSQAQVDATEKGKAPAISISPPQEPAIEQESLSDVVLELWGDDEQNLSGTMARQSTMNPLAPTSFPSTGTVTNQNNLARSTNANLDIDQKVALDEFLNDLLVSPPHGGINMSNNPVQELEGQSNASLAQNAPILRPSQDMEEQRKNASSVQQDPKPN